MFRLLVILTPKFTALLDMSFREKVSRSCNNQCVVSHYHIDECDAAHLLPRHICEQLGIQNYLYHSNNGIILNECLHRLFDRFAWTFDVFDPQPIECHEEYIGLPIIVKDTKENYSINHYILESGKQRYFPLPIGCLPFLYMNYQCYFAVNYHFANFEPIDVFEHHLNNETVFKTLFNVKKASEWVSHISKRQANRRFRMVLEMRQKAARTQYKLLWDFKPFSSSQWVSRSTIPKWLDKKLTHGDKLTQSKNRTRSKSE